MRISDWSSDVCSSDLIQHGRFDRPHHRVWTAAAEKMDMRVNQTRQHRFSASVDHPPILAHRDFMLGSNPYDALVLDDYGLARYWLQHGALQEDSAAD